MSRKLWSDEPDQDRLVVGKRIHVTPLYRGACGSGEVRALPSTRLTVLEIRERILRDGKLVYVSSKVVKFRDKLYRVYRKGLTAPKDNKWVILGTWEDFHDKRCSVCGQPTKA